MTKVILVLFLVLNFHPIHIKAQTKEVIAQKGDGIYRLLTRNGLPVSDYMTAFIELNKNLLGKNNTLVAGVKYKLPDSGLVNESPAGSGGAFSTYSIFGKDYERVEILDNTLKGAVYYLVAGHGGPDPGAVGKYGNHSLCEDEYAYDVTLRLARRLIEHGASVYMITRDPNDGIRNDSYLKADKDERCYPNQSIPLNQVKRLRQRTDAVNNLYLKNKTAFQRMIAIHVDSRSRGENIDVFFYHDKRSDTGNKAADILLKTFQDKYNQHQPGRGYKGSVSSRNLYVVKNTYPVAVYIELGNINHTRDQQRFIRVDNRQAVANWLAEGLITDFKTNK
ncbi:N-acetylmuramoyl-L-alanine amidase family protein [Maribellus maritimus]|uniref:N-acetylmuramoyl-L-alanine amidase family protein n=1 Tax=Maribellus maritimus TaxID=2870838 RepID=UPI001EEB41BE|nr:N-acetylmuramoyl-L-alanine amidase [Maribellus maritimus]MCG6187564.1 N-acetylmuramoyl-L-alanine amidase [Maribellus maritimus]